MRSDANRWALKDNVFFSGSDAERALSHTPTPLDPAGSHRAGRGELTADGGGVRERELDPQAWLLEIFDRKRDGRFLGVCNPGTAARGLFGDLGLLSAHTCLCPSTAPPRPALGL